jgi:hypothetical protein
MLAYAERLLRLSSEAEAAIRTGTPRGTLRRRGCRRFWRALTRATRA